MNTCTSVRSVQRLGLIYFARRIETINFTALLVGKAHTLLSSPGEPYASDQAVTEIRVRDYATVRELWKVYEGTPEWDFIGSVLVEKSH